MRSTGALLELRVCRHVSTSRQRIVRVAGAAGRRSTWPATRSVSSPCRCSTVGGTTTVLQRRGAPPKPPLLSRLRSLSQATALSPRSDGPDACETVETHLFAALRATRLVDSKASWASCEYSRCGRTDRGVSALRQLVVLRARCSEGAEELDYVGCLNRQLPEDIRVLSWRPAPDGFSARFNARWRQYKYFFWQDGTLDTRAMAVAAARLCGEHDFRNICKMDVDVVSNFVRRIISFTVQDESTSEEHAQPGARRMGRMGTLWSLNVRGSAFLWHQVRCMATLLFMVGRGLESPDVIDALLDVQSMPGKPAYDMAAEEPLVLFDCGYEDEAGAFVGAPLPEAASTPERTHALLVEHLTGLARGAEVRARVCAYALQAALARGDPERKALQHVPLLRRRREASFEEQVARRPPGKVKARRPAEQRGESAADGE